MLSYKFKNNMEIVCLPYTHFLNEGAKSAKVKVNAKIC